MTFEIFALFVWPILIAAIGGAIAWLYIWNLKRHDRQHPAE